jgi:hypothetical protein
MGVTALVSIARYPCAAMAALSFSASAGEALALGLAIGPMCLASCGPVVLPWMLVQPRGLAVHSQQLSIFLAGRLAGYLLFASVVWSAAATLPSSWGARSWVFGAVQLALAVGLLVYAAGRPQARCAAAPRSEFVHITPAPSARPRHAGAATLGFLTGINLCPPFLVAGIRAAQLPTLAGALFFFLCFFVGTAVWFTPFLSLGAIRRTPAFLTVARMVAVLLACWYAFTGAAALIQKVIYG